MRYWLFKSEPISYSIDALKKDKVTAWEGVRNYQARNFLRDEVKVGDKVLFYHSNTQIPGIAGVAEVSSAPYPDKTQFDKKSHYFDPKATKKNPRWYLVDVKFKRKFKEIIPLEYLKFNDTFKDMIVTQKGSRLSIQPVPKAHFDKILKLSA
jgi:predicted RNA-binding protein with PUA-like domain